MAKYSQTSPYLKTPQNNINLGMFVPRTITAEADDQTYTIERTYAYRPDLLAYDLVVRLEQTITAGRIGLALGARLVECGRRC